MIVWISQVDCFGFINFVVVVVIVIVIVTVIVIVIVGIILYTITSCCCHYNCIEACEFQRSAGRMWTVSLGYLLPVLGGA